MHPCIRIYYSTVHWRLNMFREAYHSSLGALTVFAASGLHTHVLTGRSQVWVETGQFPLWLDYHSSLGALTVFAASGLHTHVVTGRSQVWAGISSSHSDLFMFRAAYRSSSGAVTVFAASGLHTHVVTGRSQVWVGTSSSHSDLTTAGHHLRM